jgi:protocatechuate 3,4-dioxygenase beta subunit
MINNKLSFTLAFFACFLHISLCNAQKLDECITTPEIWSVGVLPKVEKSNNLTQSYASFESAQGQKIMLTGKVLDGDCVPISEAKVSVWQANSKGIFQFDREDRNGFDKHFKGSGSSFTNNLGDFQFITIYPGKVNGINPNIILRVEHPGFATIETKMFFPEHDNLRNIKNLNHSIINKQIPLLIAKKVGKKDETLLYSFVITLKGVNSYRGY